MANILGGLLRGVRESMGLSQGEVANRLGVTQVTVSRHESGEREIGSAWVDRYAAALGVRASTLYDLLTARARHHESDAA